MYVCAPTCTHTPTTHAYVATAEPIPTEVNAQVRVSSRQKQQECCAHELCSTPITEGFHPRKRVPITRATSLVVCPLAPLTGCQMFLLIVLRYAATCRARVAALFQSTAAVATATTTTPSPKATLTCK